MFTETLNEYREESSANSNSNSSSSDRPRHHHHHKGHHKRKPVFASALSPSRPDEEEEEEEGNVRFAEEALILHNRLRTRHQAEPIVLSEKVGGWGGGREGTGRSQTPNSNFSPYPNELQSIPLDSRFFFSN